MTRDKPQIALKTVLDWAYCEAKVWWETVGLEIRADAERMIRPRTGKMLLEEAVQGSLLVQWRQYQKGSEYDLPTLIGKAWQVRLEKWDLLHLREDLVTYARKYRELMSRFGADGDIRKKNGALYENPTWSFRWRDLAISMGIADLRRKIDQQQHKAGLGGATETSDKKMWLGPIGLADAFALSQIIVAANNFAHPKGILGIVSDVFVELPHIRVSVQPDIIIDAGLASEEEKEDETRRLIYELHWYDMRPPRISTLLNDYRTKALFSALPKGFGDASVKSVLVRHLITGGQQHLTPRKGAGLSEISSMASAVHRRLEALDFSGPRMVNGWEACADCEYKPLCFDGDGLMSQYNLPLSGTIQAADELLGEMRSRLRQYPADKIEDAVELSLIVLPWITRYPGMTVEQVEWIFESMVPVR